VFLARLTFFDEVGAVLFHCSPKVPGPQDSCCHCFGAGVVSTGSFMYFLHDVRHFIVRNAPE